MEGRKYLSSSLDHFPKLWHATFPSGELFRLLKPSYLKTCREKHYLKWLWLSTCAFSPSIKRWRFLHQRTTFWRNITWSYAYVTWDKLYRWINPLPSQQYTHIYQKIIGDWMIKWDKYCAALSLEGLYFNFKTARTLVKTVLFCTKC